MKPLFMWAGGKTRLIKKYLEKEVLPDTFDKYIEPFLGAGAMFAWAYNKNPDAEFVLGDLNPGIMRIYEAVRDDVDSFVHHLDIWSSVYLPLPKGETDKGREKELQREWALLCAENPCRRYFYFMLRDKHTFEYQKWSATKEASMLYFLMKTGFNGVWQENQNTNGRFGTPAGLLNQKDKVYDKDNVYEWNAALQGSLLLTGGFEDTLSEVTENAFVFLDPPYRGSFTQYGVDFDDDLQERVISYLNASTNLGAYSMMSNRDIEDGFFEDRKGNNDLIHFEVTYTAGRRKKNDDGTHSAKKAKEILMIGKKLE